MEETKTDVIEKEELQTAEAGEETGEETLSTEKPEEPSENQGRSKFVYGIRIACGGYLAYLSWKLTGSVGEAQGWHKAVVIAAIGLFALAGIGLVIFSVRNLLREKKQ